MSLKKIRLFAFIVIALIIVVFVIINKQMFAEEPLASDTVVAVINGKGIKYESIRVQGDHPSIFYKINEGIITKDQIPEYILKEEKGRLFSQINDLILWDAINATDLMVTEGEVNDHIDKILASMTDSLLHAQYTTTKVLVEALKEAIRYPKRTNEIYEKKLKPHDINYYSWHDALKQFTTIEELNKFEKNLKLAFTKEYMREQYEKNAEGIKKTILKRKFYEHLMKDISVSDSEVVMLYKERYKSGRTAFDDVKENLRQEIYREKKEKKRKQWWQEQLEKADIDVKVDEFKDVVEQMLTADPIDF